MAVLLDSSFLHSYLREEPGAEEVGEVLADALADSVNWAEVKQKSLFAGLCLI